jgi:hypothetical protein
MAAAPLRNYTYLSSNESGKTHFLKEKNRRACARLFSLLLAPQDCGALPAAING